MKTIHFFIDDDVSNYKELTPYIDVDVPFIPRKDDVVNLNVLTETKIVTDVIFDIELRDGYYTTAIYIGLK